MVNSRETAADLLQETYVRLLRLADTRSVEQPRALLHRIAANLAIDHLRASKSRLHAAEPLETAIEVPCQAPSQERTLLGKERLQMFIRAVEALPPRTREAFLLYRIQGYAYRDIATKMGVSISGVDKHIRRAIDRINLAAEIFGRAE